MQHGISIPKSIVLKEKAASPFIPCVVKAQLLFGNRADLGGISICKDKAQADSAISKLFNATFKNEQVKSVLVEELIEMQKQYYLSFLFDTDTRSPVMLFSAEGGTGIEKQTNVQKLVIDEIEGLSEAKIKDFLKQAKAEALAPLLAKLWKVFIAEDCKLLEINPVAQTQTGYICLDAHIELDDFAKSRHKERTFSERSPLGRPFTERERAVKLASEADYHGIPLIVMAARWASASAVMTMPES